MKGDESGRHDDAERLLRIIVRSRFKLSTRQMEEVLTERERVRDTKRWCADSVRERDGYPAPDNKDGEKPMLCCKCG